MRRSLMILAVVSVVVAAAVGKAVVVPILFALLLAIVLSPLVRVAQRAGLPPAFGAAVVLAGIVGLTGGALSAAIDPLAYWASKTPEAIEVWRTEVARIRNYLSREPARRPAALKDVRVRERDKPVIETGAITTRLLSGLRSTVIGAGASLILAYFMLVAGRSAVFSAVAMLRTHRARRLAWRWASDVRKDLTRYLTTVSIINAGLGALTAAGLWWAGVREPLLLGAIVAFLNFVPFLGALFSAALLAVVGLVTYGTTLMSLSLPAAFLVLHLIESQFVTPTLLGRAVTLNPLFVMLAIVVFGGIWGLSGALLAVPLLIAAKITFALVPGWTGWARVLGERRPPYGSRDSPNSLASGSGSRRSSAETSSAASIENVMPLPPNPSTASTRSWPGNRPIDGSPDGVTPNDPAQASAG
jgi:predicted PurR-regulated permease PerM